MGRPVYVTPDQENKQQDMINTVCSNWRAKAQRMPRFHSFSHLMELNEMKFGAIPKNRIVYPHYPDIALSKKKLTRAIEQSEKKISILFFVTFGNEIRWAEVFNPLHGIYPLEIYTGGREDRNDPHDKEDCYYIPVKEFKPLSVKFGTIRKVRRKQ